MGEVGILVYAYGALSALMLLEMAVSYYRRDNQYRSSELHESLSMAVSYQLFELFTRGLTLIPYIALASLSPWLLPSDKVWGWAIAFLLVDLLGYVGHRLMHEVNFLWALHEGHHSSEAFNLGMGPRQSFFVGLAQPVFVLPLALVVPVEMLVTLQAFELLWALLLHTPYVGKLGWLEELFSTPSHHRVHHGRNAKYLDRNHGGVLILWDRLFGTFQREEETPLYGITTTLPARGMWQVSTHRFRQLWRMSRQTRKLSDKLGLWLRRPDYCPKDLQLPGAPLEVDSRRYRLSNTQASLGLRSYTTVQFFLASAGLPLLILQADRLVLYEKGLLCALILAALGSITSLLEAERGAPHAEGLRLVLSSAALSLVFPAYVGAWAWLWAALSLLGLMAVPATRPVQKLNPR